ncbi:tyrosine-type recombinase/integrase [Corynebacterium halotolerans]|uniref:Integrase family protein n=1 Tax=Corynebacterium halotolerans YIM 70093 = DSM 44683 TaxID=1121362 RepID=M1NNZ0_9CORY|nr:tyrosine-type recombinase/integrase [Corynebacterium halotolerans]AGF73058.1 integrase family protein [Corynebacterium halotolerans YIM 70093 = DSM 44683]
MGQARRRIGELGPINVDKVGPKKWVARTSVRNLAGRWLKVQATADTRLKAEELVRDRAHDRAYSGSIGHIDADTTLLELVDKTLQALRSGQAGQNSRVQTINLYERHVGFLTGEKGDPDIGRLRLGECSVTVIQAWLDSVSRRVPTSARMLKILLTHAFDLALRHGVDLWSMNPARTARLRPPKREEPVVLTQEEIDGLWEHVEAWEAQGKRTDLTGIVATLLATGVRPAEALAIRWEDVNLTTTPAQLTVSGTIVRQDGVLIRQEMAKSEAGYRMLVLPAWYAEMLRERRRDADNELVFPNWNGGILDPHNVGNRFRDARGEEFAHIQMKHFRSTVATLIERAYGVEEAARHLGHASPAVTGRYYIRRPKQAGDHTSALERLEPGSEGSGAGGDDEAA